MTKKKTTSYCIFVAVIEWNDGILATVKSKSYPAFVRGFSVGLSTKKFKMAGIEELLK